MGENSNQGKQSSLSVRVAIDPTPEKAVSHYFQTKFENNLIIKEIYVPEIYRLSDVAQLHFYRKKPEWEVPRLSPATELIMAKRELLAAEKNLEIRREEQKFRREELEKEWNDLLEKELGLREAFIKFNKFARKNYERRERAEKKIKEEKELQESRDKEIEELQDKVNYMKSIKDEMEKHVKEHQIYKNFLEEVVLVSNDMRTAYSILNRYETLASARLELAARQEKDLSTLETARTEMIKLIEEKSQIMMGLNTELAQLQIRYDRAKALSLRWETALTRIKNISAEKALELDQVKICCWNLYTAMCIRKNVEMTIEPDNIEEQLVFIKRSIQELRRILRIVQKKAAKEISSTTQTQSDVLT